MRSRQAQANVPTRARSARLHRSAIAAAALAVLAPAHAVVYNWSEGTYVGGVTSPNPLQAGDVLNINAGNSKFFSNVSFDNQGSVNWNADMLYLSSATINNSGTWNAASDDTLSFYSGAQPVFNNTGALRKTGGSGSTTIGAISFVNSGVIDAQVGTINFNGGGASFLAGTQFIGAGTVAVTSNASFSGAFTASNLELRAGTFNGNAAVVNGSAAFSGGSLSGSWQVASGQQLLLQSGASKLISGGTLTNLGTVRWQGGSDNLYMSSAGIDNQGSFDVQGDLTLYHYSGATPGFNNTGTVQVAAGHTLTVGGAAFSNNGGTLNAAAGATINYAGGNVTFNAGTQFSGAGRNVVTGNARFVDGFTSQNLTLQGGTFYGGDGVTAGSTAVLNGSVAFTGGALSQNWEVAAGQSLLMGDGSAKYLGAAALVNKGTVRWQGVNDGALYFSSSSVDNQGLFEAQNNLTLVFYSGSLPVFTNSAGGTVRATAGATLTVGGIAFVNNGGALNANAGATINYAGNNATFNAGTQFSGAGNNVVTGNARFVDGFTSQNLTLQSGTFYGGDGATAGSTAVLNGNVVFTGGTLSQNWEVAPGQSLLMGDGTAKFLGAAALVNKGTLRWQGVNGGALYFSSSSLDNQGLFEAQSSVTLIYYNGSTPVFTNSGGGTVRATAGAVLTVGGIAFVNNGGVLDAAAGSTINYNGGNATFNAGTQFSGAGSNVVTANARFVDGFTSQNLTLQSGVFDGGDGVTAGSSAVLNGSVRFTGGTLRGNWEVAAGQTLSGEGGNDKYLGAAALVNKGSINWSGGMLYLSSSSIDNQGRLDLQNDGQFFYYTGSQPTLVNNGLLLKSGGSGVSDISGLAVANNGRIDVQSGTLRLPNNFANAGTIMGVGSVATSTLTNNGHMAPGGAAAPGTLTLVGNFIQTSMGSFDIDVNSLASHDLMLVSGAATLDGLLAVACFADCSYAVGDEIVVLDYSGTRSGSFAGLALSGFETGNFSLVYDDANHRVLLSVTETVTAAVPEPESWALMLGGLAALASIVRRRRA